MKKITLLVIIVIYFTSCNKSTDKLSPEKSSEYSKSGSRIVKMTFDSLKAKLVSTLADRGIPYALEYCNVHAIPLTKALEQNEKIIIRRTSLKFRNSMNKPDSIEEKILNSFEKDMATGVKLPTNVMLIGEEVHFFQPIMLDKLCLKCHGEPLKDIDSSSFATLNRLYPLDKATGFHEGDFRGMWHVVWKK